MKRPPYRQTILALLRRGPAAEGEVLAAFSSLDWPDRVLREVFQLQREGLIENVNRYWRLTDGKLKNRMVP